MNYRLKWGLVIAALVGILAFGLAWLPTVAVVAESDAELTFVLDVPMTRVRKILVRTNAVKTIVAMANAEFLDQHWLQLKFETERPSLATGWHFHGSGDLQVRTENASIGRWRITLNQTVDIVPDQLQVTSRLAEPVGPIQAYDGTLRLTPDANGQAELATTLKLKIETRSSWMTAGLVKRRIREAAAQALDRQQQAIREVVQKHANDWIIFPELGGADD